MIKTERLNKIFNPQSKKTVIIPMDHGVYCGPIAGLINTTQTLRWIKEGGANAVILHKGLARHHQQLLQEINLPYLLHLSASTGLGATLQKVLVADVREADELGAVGVSVLIYLGNQYEPEMLRDLGQVTGQAQKLNMPVFAMMYIANKVNDKVLEITNAQEVAQAARIGAELGVDIVEVRYTGSQESFKKTVNGCLSPVIMAGRSKDSQKEFLERAHKCLEAGAAGVSWGRKIFQAEDVLGLVREICQVVHGN